MEDGLCDIVRPCLKTNKRKESTSRKSRGKADEIVQGLVFGAGAD